MSDRNPVQPALDAAQQLRTAIKDRIGKEGGNLNGRMLGYIDTIESVLLNIPVVHSMFNTVQNQMELVRSGFRTMEKEALRLEAVNEKLGKLLNGEPEPSETKGQ